MLYQLRLYITKRVCVKGICVFLKKYCVGFFFLTAVRFQLICYQPKGFKKMILILSFCTMLFCIVYGYSRLFIPKVNLCAAFHVMLPFASIVFSSEHFNTLYLLRVIVI